MEALEQEEENCTLRALEESLEKCTLRALYADVRRKRERSGGSPQAQTDPCAWAGAPGLVGLLGLQASLSMRRSRDLETTWIAAASQLETFSWISLLPVSSPRLAQPFRIGHGCPCNLGVHLRPHVEFDAYLAAHIGSSGRFALYAPWQCQE